MRKYISHNTSPQRTSSVPHLLVIITTIFICQSHAPAVYAAYGLTSLSITDIDNSNSPPTATIEYAQEGDTYTLSAAQSTDPDGSISEYQWDFGDGENATGVTVTHHFENIPAEVTLTVIDNQGGMTLTRSTLFSHTEPFEIIVDDADESAFSTVGSWGNSTVTDGYYNVGYKTAPNGDGSLQATWKFDLPTAGNYTIYCYYTAYANRATNAPFTINNNGNEVSTLTVNQQVNGNTFFALGSFTLTGGELMITLTNGGNGYSIADAVKVQFNPAN